MGIEIGVSHYEEIGIPRPASFAHEPDWYGLFSAYSAIWLLVMYLLKDTSLFSMKFIRIAMAICLLGSFLVWQERVSYLSYCRYFSFFCNKKFKVAKNDHISFHDISSHIMWSIHC